MELAISEYYAAMCRDESLLAVSRKNDIQWHKHACTWPRSTVGDFVRHNDTEILSEKKSSGMSYSVID